MKKIIDIFKKNKIKTIIFFILLISIFLAVNIDHKAILKSILPNSTKLYIKKLFFGEKYIREVQFYRTSNFNQNILPKTEFQKLKFEKLSLEFLDKLEGTGYQQNNNRRVESKTFFVDVVNKNLLITTKQGEFYLLKDFKSDAAIKIESNLENKEFIDIMDTEIIDSNIYISYRQNIENGERSFFHFKKSKFNLQKLKFENIFSPLKSSINNYGGRIVKGEFQGKSGVFLTTGATGDDERHLAQDDSSHLGKILFFPINKKEYQIISKGHRNPQGLYAQKDLILATEHGPYGGDEINKIINGGNYGWPISSYGEKYNYFDNQHKKNRYEYLKSHSTENFIEPIFSFVPSIGISEIVRIPNSFSKYWQNNYFISSLNGVSLYRTEFDKEFKKIKYLEKIILLERIRDIEYVEHLQRFVLALESSGSIGFLSIENN